MLTSALSVEAATERYGAPSFFARASLPATEIVGFGQISCLALLLIWAVVSSLNRGARLSQAWVWSPFLMVWILAALLISPEKPPVYVWLSAVVIATGVLMGQTLGADRALATRLALVASRAVVLISLGLGWAFPERAFAPYAVWPGGWWVGADRLQGILPHPNTLAWIAVLSFGLELTARGFASTKLRTLGRAVWMVPPLVALLLSGSRTSTIALALGLVGIIVVSISRRSIVGRALLPAVAILSLAATVSVTGLVIIELGTLNGRLQTWGAALNAYLNSPLFGVGPGTQFDVNIAYAHNQVFQVMAELGTLGLVALLVHVGALLRLGRQSVNTALATYVILTWVGSFATENMLRVATINFVPTILLLQLALYSIGSRELNEIGGPAGDRRDK